MSPGFDGAGDGCGVGTKVGGGDGPGVGGVGGDVGRGVGVTVGLELGVGDAVMTTPVGLAVACRRLSSGEWVGASWKIV